MGGGGWYTTWDDPNMGKATQYMDREGMLGNRADSYKEDHYSYVWRDVVDVTVIEEDF
jgi:hypothetical protein